LTEWVSIVALTGWLVLSLGAFRAQRVGAGKTVVMGLAWIAIFLLVAGVFALVAPVPRPWRP
jgi:hypothetical protein